MGDHPVTLSVSLTYSQATARSTPRGVWYASALPDADLDRLAAAADALAAGDEVVRRVRDASLLFVGVGDGVATRLIAWKGLMSIHEVYYAALRDSGWLVTDHFRNALASIPTADRMMGDDALLQHYVGAAVYGRSTYSRAVDRLLNGDRVDIDLVAGTAEVSIFSRHESTATDEPMERHLDRLDAAFEDVIAPLRSVPHLGAGFSGGVDSTLLLSYLGAHGTALTVVPGSPEFDAETVYAREAASLLGRTTHEIELDESDYLHHLERHILAVGMPAESYASPVLAKVYEYPVDTFLVGDAADSVFGSGRGIRRVASFLSGSLGRAALRAAERAPGGIGARAKQVGDYAALFAEPPSSPNGYAGSALEYHGDMSLTVRMLGTEPIYSLNRRMLQEVTDRVDLETEEDDGFFRHIELTQWRYLFADLALVGNHTVQALGKEQVQPYSSWRVISEHLKVPARQRYYRGFAGKWMLKELLARRLPDYRVNKRKLATGLPFARYYANGPLARVWDRYEVPSVIPAELHDAIRSAPSPMTWKAITHAIWLDQVVKDADLAAHPAALAVEWPTRS